MSVSFNLGSTFYGEQEVSFRALTAVLVLVKDPGKQSDEKGYKKRPEQQREQYAEEATPIMPPLIIEPIPPIIPPPPNVETNSSTTLAPTRAPRSIFKPSLILVSQAECVPA